MRLENAITPIDAPLTILLEYTLLGVTALFLSQHYELKDPT